MTNDGNRTFATKKITNNDIYEEILSIKKAMVSHVEEDRRSFASLKERIARNYWISGTALALIIVVIGVILKG